MTSKTLLLGESWDMQDKDEIAHLEYVSKISGNLTKADPPLDGDRLEVVPDEPPDGTDIQKEEDSPGPESAPLSHAANVMAVMTRSAVQDVEDPERPVMGPLEFQAERWRRIRSHQNVDENLSDIKDFLIGEVDRFSPKRFRRLAKVSDLFILDTRDVLHRLARSTRDRPRDSEDEPRLVVPAELRPDMLHYAHEDYQGGHQGEAPFGILLARHVSRRPTICERMCGLRHRKGMPSERWTVAWKHRAETSVRGGFDGFGDPYAKVRPREYIFITLPGYLFRICHV